MSDVEKNSAGVTGSAIAVGGDKEKSKFVRDFSRVIITLENIVIPDDSLSPTPSEVDGLTRDTEMDLRILGCELIQTAGILLKLPQVAMATGQVLFQRFYYSKSFVKHTMEIVAMACINLASKVEEAPRRIRDVVNVFHHIKQFKQKKTISPLILDQNYVNLKNQVIKSERRVLKELGFCVHVKHPHKIIVMYLQVLEAERNQRLLQCACAGNYMNDSFRTNAFVRFNPETIASACIYLAARQLQIPLPNDPQWFLVFGINEHDIRQVCMAILRLYTRSKPNADELEKIVGEIKKQHIEAKLKAKELATLGASSNHGSATATPENSNQSPSIAAKKKTDAEKFDSIYDSRKDSGQATGHKRSRSRSRSRSLVKKLRSDDSEKSRSYNSSSRSRSRSPRLKIQPPQQHSHASKKDDYYPRQKGRKHAEKYSGSDGIEWKKHKSLNSIRSEFIVDLTAKYSKDNKKDRHYKLDLKLDDRYKNRSKYARDEISPPPPVRGYSSSPERLTKKKSKHKNKIVAKSPTDRLESKERNGQSRIGRSNHHGRRAHRR